MDGGVYDGAGPGRRLATDVEDAPACIGRCQRKFLDSIGTATAAALADGEVGVALDGRRLRRRAGETLAPVCEALTGHEAASGQLPRFWPLYCCDQELCGVYFSQMAGLTGQDPNVNSIINRCQNIGFHSVFDPGPPSSCAQSRRIGAPMSTTASLSEQPALTSTPYPTLVLVPAAVRTATASAQITATTGSGPATVSLSSTDTDDDGGAARTRIAGLLCATLLVLLLIGLLIFFLVRRRRSRVGAGSHDRVRTMDTASPAADAAPLVAAPDGRPTASRLVPPPRLRERRLLSTVRATVPPTSPSLILPWSPALPPPRRPPPSCPAFPLSPLCAPTTHKLVPRREHTGRLPGVGRIRPIGSLSLVRSSVRSPLAETPPTTPTRPRRPHDEPLQIPDLVSPARSVPAVAPQPQTMHRGWDAGRGPGRLDQDTAAGRCQS